MISGMHAPSANPHTPNFYKEPLPEGQGEGALSSTSWGARPDWTVGTGLQDHPATLHSHTAPSSHMPTARRRLPKRSQGTTSAHALPTETKSSGPGCQVPPSNLVDILIEEEHSQRPPNGNAPCRGTFVFISFCCQ